MEGPTSFSRSIRVALEGCGHGCLHDIYASVQRAAALKGWDGVDLVIIGGDFQAVRNSYDLACMSVPQRFKAIGDFHEYYSGKRIAPYLTIFVGGNHEASNYLFELYYGGWVAPNIYFLGAANVIRCGPLRIAGMSGIWKGYDFRKPHFERLPYNQEDIHGIYHIRELDVRKLLQIRTQVDLGLSHDWPKGVELSGNYESLFQRKKGFREDSNQGKLGNPAAKYVLDRLRPAYWFSAHLHVLFAALIQHGEYIPARRAPKPKTEPAPHKGSSQILQPPKVPYSFGLDGSVLTSILADDDEETVPDTARTEQGTESIGIAPKSQDGSMHPGTTFLRESPANAVSNNSIHSPPEAQPKENQNVVGDTQNRLSAWKNFYHVAAENEAEENTRFLEEQDKFPAEEFPESKHSLTWHKVDLGEDGDSRRVINTERPEERENKKQKTQHEARAVKNSDEIDLDLDSDSDKEVAGASTSGNEDVSEHKASSLTNNDNTKNIAENAAKNSSNVEGSVSEELRSQLPASFTRPEPAQVEMNGPLPEEISNTVTQFLALDKCLPHKDFLQLTEFHAISDQDNVHSERPYRLQYDKEWLAITRVFADDLHLGNPSAKSSPDRGDAFYKPLIMQEEEWIEENVVKPGKLTIPENFTPTAPFYDPAVPITTKEMPPEYENPQTAQFCELIGIENKFHLSDEERQARMEAGPRPDADFRGPSRGGYNRNRRGGRGRGGFRR